MTRITAGIVAGVALGLALSWHSDRYASPSEPCLVVWTDADHADTPIPRSWDYDGSSGWWFDPSGTRVGWSAQEDAILYDRPCPHLPAYLEGP